MITKELVKEGLEKSGCKLISRDFGYVSSGCLCAISAALYAKGSTLQESFGESVVKYSLFENNLQMWSFIKGFDSPNKVYTDEFAKMGQEFHQYFKEEGYL